MSNVRHNSGIFASIKFNFNFRTPPISDLGITLENIAMKRVIKGGDKRRDWKSAAVCCFAKICTLYHVQRVLTAYYVILRRILDSNSKKNKLLSSTSSIIIFTKMLGKIPVCDRPFISIHTCVRILRHVYRRYARKITLWFSRDSQYV